MGAGARPDFVSQGSLDSGVDLPADALGHEAVAARLVAQTEQLPAGSVIAVQAPWGRGKTDVLARVERVVRENKIVVSINPWQYGDADLLTPLVLALIELIPPPKRSSTKALRRIAETILRAGVNFGLKAAAPTVPLFGVAAGAVDKLLGGLFKALDTQADANADDGAPDADPVAMMGKRFRELVDALIVARELPGGTQLLVCVDDIDRCLPDRQVALLEAIRFLISSGASATFLIALDPTLARQAIKTHYNTDAFDPDRYLDKMFDLRVNLPAVGKRLGELLHGHFERRVKIQEWEGPLAALLALLVAPKAETPVESHQHVKDAQAALHHGALKALVVPSFQSPRVVRRIFDRLLLLGAPRSATRHILLFSQEMTASACSSGPASASAGPTPAPLRSTAAMTGSSMRSRRSWSATPAARPRRERGLPPSPLAGGGAGARPGVACSP